MSLRFLARFYSGCGGPARAICLDVAFRFRSTLRPALLRLRISLAIFHAGLLELDEL